MNNCSPKLLLLVFKDIIVPSLHLIFNISKRENGYHSYFNGN